MTADARLVWDTWRRILTSDALSGAVMNPQNADITALDLTDDERAIVADYASDPVAADMTIGMYRRGLVRNTLTALNLVPLTRGLLDASELDAESVAEDFIRSIGYRDDGPNFWRAAADFVDFLATQPAFASPVHQDVMALDRATIAMVRRLGENPPALWPESAGVIPAPARESERYVASPAATVASSHYDLTPWLVDPLDFDADEELESATRYWLIYVPDAGSMHTYAELSERTARAFTLLAEPKTPAELSAALDGLAMTEVLDVLDSLLDVGAIARVQEPVTA